jgi:GNAT superfamily N-acetyltransferase
MRFLPIEFTRDALAEYSQLFGECFPEAGSRFTPEYLEWLYVANPDGRAVGFDARDGATLAAHYVCIPVSARIDGQVVSVLLSLNTATRPAFQGKGLFTKLAAMTYDSGAAAGYAGVYGVANANSTPGFVRKLGFQLVRPLEAMVGIGGLGLRAQTVQQPLSFERIWSADSLRWRCANPINPVRCNTNASVWQFFVPGPPMVSAYAELAPEHGWQPVGTSAPYSPLRLYLGLVPDAVRGFGSYASIPARLRPSPLNLIYRPLTAGAAQLDPSTINFTFLDFDAY